MFSRRVRPTTRRPCANSSRSAFRTRSEDQRFARQISSIVMPSSPSGRASSVASRSASRSSAVKTGWGSEVARLRFVVRVLILLPRDVSVSMRGEHHRPNVRE